MLESRLEANLGRCWAWSSKPVVRHFVSRVGSTPTSFRHSSRKFADDSRQLLSNNDRRGGILINDTAAENGHFALQILDVRRGHAVKVVAPDRCVRPSVTDLFQTQCAAEIHASDDRDTGVHLEVEQMAIVRNNEVRPPL